MQTVNSILTHQTVKIRFACATEKIYNACRSSLFKIICIWLVCDKSIGACVDVSLSIGHLCVTLIKVMSIEYRKNNTSTHIVLAKIICTTKYVTKSMTNNLWLYYGLQWLSYVLRHHCLSAYDEMKVGDNKCRHEHQNNNNNNNNINNSRKRQCNCKNKHLHLLISILIRFKQ